MGKLTVAQIRALKDPGRYSDGDGLILEFTRPGRAYWFVRVQHNGRRRDIGLGPVDEITLAKARDKAHEARKSLAKGIDPTIERQKAKLKIPTFREAAKLVHEEHKAAWKNGKHQDQWISRDTLGIGAKVPESPILPKEPEIHRAIRLDCEAVQLANRGGIVKFVRKAVHA